MNANQAAGLLRTMKANWVHAVIDDDVSDLWLNSFAVLDFDQARQAIGILIERSPDFWPTLGGLNEAIRELGPAHPPRAIGRGSCGGVGWIEHDEHSSVPCPACNPGLDTIWQDEAMRKSYRQGVPVHVLMPTEFAFKNGVITRNAGMPERCLPFVAEPTVTPTEGKRIAALAYEDECNRTGRQPNWGYFNKSIGLAGTDAPAR